MGRPLGGPVNIESCFFVTKNRTLTVLLWGAKSWKADTRQILKSSLRITGVKVLALNPDFIGNSTIRH